MYRMVGFFFVSYKKKPIKEKKPLEIFGIVLD